MSASPVKDVSAERWSADTTVVKVADRVVQLAGAEPFRRKLTVVTDPDSVGSLFLVPDRGRAAGGVRLAPGAGFVFTHVAEVCAYVTGGDVTVYLVAETGAC